MGGWVERDQSWLTLSLHSPHSRWVGGWVGGWVDPLSSKSKRLTLAKVKLQNYTLRKRSGHSKPETRKLTSYKGSNDRVIN